MLGSLVWKPTDPIVTHIGEREGELPHSLYANFGEEISTKAVRTAGPKGRPLVP